jgi:hypothetical protein
MGILLTLLIPGCERDAPVCIDPYPDEALFYLHYSPGANPFLDYVVPLMAASSHKPSVISAVVQ